MASVSTEPASTLASDPVAARTTKQRLTNLTQHHSYGFAALLMVAVLVATLIKDGGNFGVSDQLGIAAPMILAAMASAPSIIGRGFDLSISPLLVFCGAVYVVWLAPHGLGGAIAVPIVLGVGLTAGLITGLIITLLRIQPVVVTLGMYFALQGVNLLVAPNPASLGEGDRWIYHLAGTVGPIPGAVFTIGVPLLIWYGLKRIPFRGLLYAVGSNDATAFSSGVNVTAVRVGSYAPRRAVLRLRRPRADRAGAVDERLDVDAVRADRDRGGRPRRHVAGRRSRRPDRRRLRRLHDLPLPEPPVELRGQPRLAADRLRRDPDRRRRDPGRAGARGRDRRPAGEAHARAAPPPAQRAGPGALDAGDRPDRRRRGRGRAPRRPACGERSSASSSGSR